MPVYQYQTPQTDLMQAFQELGASNSVVAQRQMAADALTRQRSQDEAAMTGAIAGAALGAVIPGGGVAAAGVGASIGSQIGRSSAGGQVDQSAILHSGLQAAGVAANMQQAGSEQDILASTQAKTAAGVPAPAPALGNPSAGTGIYSAPDAAPASPADPSLGHGPLGYSGVLTAPDASTPPSIYPSSANPPPDQSNFAEKGAYSPSQVSGPEDPMATQRAQIIAGAMKSNSPLKTAATGLGFLSSLTPALTSKVYKPGDVISTTDSAGRVVSQQQIPFEEKPIVRPAGSSIVGFTPRSAGQPASPAPTAPAASAAAPTAAPTASLAAGAAPTPPAPLQPGVQPLLVRQDANSPWTQLSGDPAAYVPKYGAENVQAAPPAATTAPTGGSGASSAKAAPAAPASSTLGPGVRMLAEGGKEHPSTPEELAAVHLPPNTPAQTDATGKVTVIPGDRAASYMERNKNQIVQQYLNLPSSKAIQDAAPHMDVIMSAVAGTNGQHTIAQDQNLVYADQKMKNPTSQVTLSEATEGKDVGSFFDSVHARLMKLAGEGKLTQTMREQLADGAVQYYKGRYELNASERETTKAKLAAAPYNSDNPERDVPPMAYKNMLSIKADLNAAKVEGRGGGKIPTFLTEDAANAGVHGLKRGAQFIGPDGEIWRKQ